MMLEVVLTKDNSPTIYNREMNAFYHSVFGAIQESEYVFIKNGLEYVKDKFDTIHILEIGFGSGMNCFLTYQKCVEDGLDKKINYIGIEKFPLDVQLVEKLSEFQPFCRDVETFMLIHAVDITVDLHKNFFVRKMWMDIQDALKEIENNSIHLIYYDAFAPSSQPEMWKKEIFEILFEKIVNGAVLVTFCAKGQFKRDLKEIGFEVQSLKGALGKREMTRAIKV
ncbi:MAG: hypothetical protein KatS3mg027_2297 [Bacteroidia bacterium]|nr:MAG: hypothetical protein KatS3mg027_2297 [Bacteroidia bacterium]